MMPVIYFFYGYKLARVSSRVVLRFNKTNTALMKTISGLMDAVSDFNQMMDVHFSVILQI